MEKATIYDYARMCKSNNVSVKKCRMCPLHEINNGEQLSCDLFVTKFPGKANETIIDWCKKHPAKTRKDVFLEHYPNAAVKTTRPGTMDICPTYIDRTYSVCCSDDCSDCMEKYWTAEAD